MKHILSCLMFFAVFYFPIENSLAKEGSTPRLVLIGDSTVKCGSGRGGGGLWGWGSFLSEHFDAEKIQVENYARGGRSSRTYLTEGLWTEALKRLGPGDFVMMQFGHNDGGKMFEGDRPRASIKGNGNESKIGVVEATGKEETVYSYGWYLRKYIADARDAGATPIVLSLIPRDRWEGKLGERRVIRADQDYGKWAREAAKDGGALFIDLNEIVARHYEELGEERVGKDFFTEKDWTHTKDAGAKLNAACVVEGILKLKDCPLRDYLISTESEQHKQSVWRFDFGAGKVAKGYQQVLPTSHYSEQSGFGLEGGVELESKPLDSSDLESQKSLFSKEPFFFSVALPEGNYRVKVFGGQHPLTVKAELRRLLLQLVPSDHNATVSGEFTVNIRTPQISNGNTVRLKSREFENEFRAWDEKLTLEFNGPVTCVSSLIIAPEPEAITVFLAGDSTVADQPHAPWASWGQMLTRFFKLGVAVANHAESGESISSSFGARRFEKIFDLMKPGDYLFLQFGHNDMKDKSRDALSTYRKNLKELVQKTRDLGGHPVLVTSMERKSGVFKQTLGDYPSKVREISAELEVPLIDLHKMSQRLYQALGNRLDYAFQDGTHHNTYGSYLLAQCVIQGILDNQLALSEYVVDEFENFDPNAPVDIESFSIRESPLFDLHKPDGE